MEKINSFVSPDLSGFDKRIDLVQQGRNDAIRNDYDIRRSSACF